MAQGNYQAPAGGGVDAEIKKQAMTSLITAIVAFFCCPLLAIWSIIAGNNALKMIEQTGQGKDHESLAKIGKILGIVVLVLAAVSIVAQIIFMVLGVGLAAAGN